MGLANSVTVLVVDPCHVFLEGISTWLRSDGFHVHCLGSVSSGSQLGRSDLVIIGPHIEPPENFKLCHIICQDYPQTKVVLLSLLAADMIIQADAAASGAWACLPRDTERNNFIIKIHHVLEGHLLFSPKALQGHVDELTPREQDVLRYLAQNLTNAAIAACLCLSKATVSNHLANINRKLGVTNRQDALQRARRRGWVD